METFYYFCDIMTPRAIKYYKRYFLDFFNSLDIGAKEKLTYIMRYVQQNEQWSQKFVKYMEDGLFEIRMEWQSNIYRVFFILDSGNLVVLFHGFHKKTQKTPRREVEKAKRIKQEYYENQ